jgi:drug/metabolite transporter (DMT)-like permease
MSLSHRGQTTGTLLGIAAVVMWGSLIGVARSVVEQMGVLWSSAAVSLISGALGLAIAAYRPGGAGRLFKLPANYLFGCGLLFVVNNVALYVAIRLASNRAEVIEVGLVNYLWPAVTVLLAVPVLGKKARVTLLPGLALAIVGIYVGMAAGGEISLARIREHLTANPMPYLLALIGACCWGLYSNLARRWAGASDGGAVPLFLLGTGVTLAVAAVFFEPFKPPVWSTRVIAEFAYLAIFPTLLAYLFWDIAMRKGNLILVSIISFFTPLISTVISCVYLKVPMGIQLWLACGLVIVGALVCQRSVTDQRSPS